MLDFETLGVSANASVVQIGACYFDRETGEIGATFKCNVDPKTNVGATIDAETVFWWLGQDRPAIDSITKGVSFDAPEAFARLNLFLGDAEAIWSHSSFDFAILTDTLRRLGMEPRFSFRAARDIRTLTDISGISPKSVPFEGVKHDALDDAKHQAYYVSIALDVVKKCN